MKMLVRIAFLEYNRFCFFLGFITAGLLKLRSLFIWCFSCCSRKQKSQAVKDHESVASEEEKAVKVEVHVCVFFLC